MYKGLSDSQVKSIKVGEMVKYALLSRLTVITKGSKFITLRDEFGNQEKIEIEEFKKYGKIKPCTNRAYT